MKSSSGKGSWLKTSMCISEEPLERSCLGEETQTEISAEKGNRLTGFLAHDKWMSVCQVIVTEDPAGAVREKSAVIREEWNFPSKRQRLLFSIHKLIRDTGDLIV